MKMDKSLKAARFYPNKFCRRSKNGIVMNGKAESRSKKKKLIIALSKQHDPRVQTVFGMKIHFRLHSAKHELSMHLSAEFASNTTATDGIGLVPIEIAEALGGGPEPILPRTSTV
jgi:hypothetical protein